MREVKPGAAERLVRSDSAFRDLCENLASPVLSLQKVSSDDASQHRPTYQSIDNARMTFQKAGRGSMTESFGLEHIDAMYGYALMLTRSHVEAEDLVQETYVRALQARHRLPDENNLKGWFFTILRNLWLNQLRKQKTGPRLVEVDGEDGGADFLPGNTGDSYQLLSAKEDADQVNIAIAQLSPEFREVIVLREFEQLSYQEIADVIDCPAGTVMSRLGRARAKLRELLA